MTPGLVARHVRASAYAADDWRADEADDVTGLRLLLRCVHHRSGLVCPPPELEKIGRCAKDVVVKQALADARRAARELAGETREVGSYCDGGARLWAFMTERNAARRTSR